jgi:hypothetical protein
MAWESGQVTTPCGGRLTKAFHGLLLAAFAACAGNNGSFAELSQPATEPVGLASSGLRGGTRAAGGFSAVRLDDKCSGTLLGPTLVGFAAHCGEPSTVSNEFDSVSVRLCKIHPDWTWSGLDFGACLLERPLAGAEAIPIVSECDVGTVRVGDGVMLASYGIDEQGEFGQLRTASGVVVGSHGDEFTVQGPELGACGGDSGSPAYRSDTGEPGKVERVVGLLSASTPGCGANEELHYVSLPPLLPWIHANF